MIKCEESSGGTPDITTLEFIPMLIKRNNFPHLF